MVRSWLHYTGRKVTPDVCEDPEKTTKANARSITRAQWPVYLKLSASKDDTEQEIPVHEAQGLYLFPAAF